MEDIPVLAVEVLKCRYCGLLVTSMKRFRRHVEKCRMLCANYGGTAAVSSFGFGDPEEMERVVLRLPKIRLMRWSSADIKKNKSARTETASVAADLHVRKQKGNRIDHSSHASTDSDDLTPTPPKRTPRKASLKALSNIRETASQIVQTTYCNLDDDDSKHSSDNFPEPKPASKRSRKTTSSRPVFGSQKRANDAQLRYMPRTTSDDVYSVHCQQCTAFFDSKSNLEKHMRNVHKHRDQYHHLDVHTCPICDRMIWRRLCFQGHLKSHTEAEKVEEAHQLWDKWPDTKDARFPCKHCLMIHSTHHSYLTHMKAKHPDVGRSFKWTCRYCSKEDFDSLKLLVSHIKNGHHKEYYGDTLKWVDGNPKNEKRPKRACDICGEMIDIYHMKTHKIKEHSVGGTSQRKFKKTPEQNKYQCPLKGCGTRLKTVPALKGHFILHLQNNPFVCKIPGCGVRTDAQSHLDRHMRIHTGEQSVVCPKCGLSYSRKDKLLTHICGVEPSRVKQYADGSKRACHSRLRLKRCKKSEISSVSTDKVDESQKMEASMVAKYGKKKERVNISKIMLSDPVFIKACEENPGFKKLITGSVRCPTNTKKPRRTYRCLKCHTFFNVVQALHKHRAICTGTKEENGECYKQNGTDLETPETFDFNDIKVKLGCRICGDSFNTSALLNKHIKNDHDPKDVFKCEECGEIFGSERSRTQHLKLKHLEQDLPFACCVCNMKYKEERILAQHMTRHANGNISIYSCPECGKELSCLDSVRRHCLSFHGVMVPYKYEAPSKKATVANSQNARKQARKLIKYEKKSETEVYNEDEEELSLRMYDPILIKVEPDLHIDADTDNNLFEDAVTEPPEVKVEANE